MRIILIIVLIYVIYQWVIKPVLGIFMQYTLKKFVDEQMKNSQGRTYNEQRKPEGSINIDYIPKEKKSNGKKDDSDDGEYVDYEVIK